MTKLKLGPIPDNKPLKLNVELPTALHSDRVAHRENLGRESGQRCIWSAWLIVPMLEQFIATDRGFAKARQWAV